MTRTAPLPYSVTLHVPFRIVKRGGRTEKHMSEGAAAPRQADNALVKALARAFRWKRMGPFAASTVAHQALGLEQRTSRLARVFCAIKGRSDLRRGAMVLWALCAQRSRLFKLLPA